MKTRLGILTTLVVIAFFSCNKQKSASINFEHADKPTVVNCSKTDTLLFKEALYTFEEDIKDFFDPQNKNLRRAYATFVRNAVNNRVDYGTVVKPHTLEVFEALKADTNLWNGQEFNFNHPIFKCIGEKINDVGLKTTYNALLTTNSMRPDLIGPPIVSKYGQAESDRYLATFIALEYYYGRLHNVQAAPQAEDKADTTPVDFNKVPAKTN